VNGCCLLLIKWNEERVSQIHVVAVNIKKKNIVSLDVTSEVHENGTMLKRLVDNASENNDVKRVIADRAYDIKENFRYRSVSQPDRSCSQGKENSNWLIGCCHLKIIIVMQQLKNSERCKAKVKYGSRRVAETDCILFYQKDIWRICFSKEVSKHGKGDDDKSVIL